MGITCVDFALENPEYYELMFIHSTAGGFFCYTNGADRIFRSAVSHGMVVFVFCICWIHQSCRDRGK